MKRAREEEGEEEQEQEQAAPAPMVATPAHNPRLATAATWNDAVDFVQAVKHTFDRAKYLEFLDIVRQVDSIGISGIVDRVKVLFRGHPDLKSYFNMFLPEQYELSLTDDD
ncbi:hypothetical protein BDA96_07G086400 [Sorghum bicolor]|uniref:Histone deacetylase interacting domain-containing protein n=2 Tax=Sorghum bicolor TaxID=4558 RepID=A0A921QK02_SORBI|nr:paired amphipathic helix protein Sin3-like 6 [Sorghum bicolor]EES14741.1 hypothetical protein SORBI_3007G083000 [Sorghum bicolor]KAG0523006.1 hypothetical protein BDA96_07G086400 [Sorghum bicolor]|eukprot:XP_002445246.1 paired amphipathic helix protein Sin3-like 6 [Sorghum bicolor]